MGSPTCPGHGPLLFDIACCVSDALTALKGTAGPDVKAAVSNLEAARALIYARDDAPTPPAPADGRRCPSCKGTAEDGRRLPSDGEGMSSYCEDPRHPAPADAPPKRGVYAVRYDDRTGRYAAAITRGGWDVLHLHVGSMRNTAENVRAVVDAMNAAHPADDATRRESASAEAMREAFAAWQMGLYPKGDDFERARVEWIPQIGGAPPEPFAVLCDGESVYLGDEWGAWQAAIRALPTPAHDDAVEEAQAAVVEAARAMHECIHATPYIRAREFAAIQDVEDAVAALLAAERDAALRREKGGDK